MNRDQRRAHRRAALGGLRRMGCTCCPSMALVPPPPGFPEAGYDVTHQAGCPLGDRFTGANRAGLVPVVVLESSRPWGCWR